MGVYIGLDVGGTFIKGGILEENNKLSVFDSVKTDLDDFYGCIVSFVHKLCNSVRQSTKSVAAIGIGLPGMVDSAQGVAVFAGNLHLKNERIVENLQRRLALPVFITNDANAAALGEARLGAGRAVKNSIFVTLGTGVGGGIIIDGKIFAGNRSQGAEIGHTVIVKDGVVCTCGRRGCFECYASATALVRQTKEAMEKNPRSKMWEIGDLAKIDAKTAFLYAKTDESAAKTVENYVDYLACGLVNLANVFRPEKILLGGGVANEGEGLRCRVQAAVERELFGYGLGESVEIAIASLKNRAGTVGAAIYAREMCE